MIVVKNILGLFTFCFPLAKICDLTPLGSTSGHMTLRDALRKIVAWSAAVGLTIGLITEASADLFGTGGNQFGIDFVAIGDSSNTDDIHGAGYGAVPYEYRMGVYEISEGMISAANSEGNLGLTQDSRSTDQPSTSITWNEAARFVNWLNTSEGFQAAYQFSTQPGDVGYDPNENLTLWSSGEAWQQGGENLFRHKDARYFLPSEDEWYKAAYFDGVTATYFDYANGKDTLPTAVVSGTTADTAVYNQSPPTEVADIMDAGGLSPYGTMAQNGNVWEWIESGFTAPNDTAEEDRIRRGGDVYSEVPGEISLQALSRSPVNPTLENSRTGFRVASIPEPSGFLLASLVLTPFLVRRKR